MSVTTGRLDRLLKRSALAVLLLVHGDRDALIPLVHSESLARKAPSARLVVIAGAAHSDLHKFASYQAALADALGALRSSRRSARVDLKVKVVN